MTPADRCPGTGMRTARFGWDEPDRCPVCDRIAYVCVDGTTGSHRAPAPRPRNLAADARLRRLENPYR